MQRTTLHLLHVMLNYMFVQSEVQHVGFVQEPQAGEHLLHVLSQVDDVAPREIPEAADS